MTTIHNQLNNFRNKTDMVTRSEVLWRDTLSHKEPTFKCNVMNVKKMRRNNPSLPQKCILNYFGHMEEILSYE